MSATITDATAHPLKLQEEFRLGQMGRALNTLVTDLHRDDQNLRHIEASNIIQAATNKNHLQHANDHKLINTKIREVIKANAKAQKYTASEAQLVHATKAAAAVATLLRTTVMLSHGVCLTLYDDLAGGEKTGGHILYERISGSGLTLVSERLKYHPIVH
ncbi:MAG: hypothetical protein H0X02_09565 [Nitrosomonas sp.]|nr:hypothetical protein [Nitrosomonas sp.]